MITSEEIKRRLWDGANELRGSMDASRYKDYMLGLMFYKFLSDKTLETFRMTAGVGKVTEDKLVEAYIEAKEEYGEDLEKMIQDVLGYYVSPKYLYQIWLKDISEGEFEVQKVTDSLSSFERSIISTDEVSDFKGLFSSSTLDLSDTALGSNLHDRSENIKALILLFADLNMVDLQKGDVLGDAYEYLIGQFAMESGKKAGEFYTPHRVSEVMAQIVAKSGNIKSIYDPTVGSGSLLLTVKKHLSNEQQKDLSYYGQEKNTATYNLTRMNLLLHGVRPEKMTIKNGDTLGNDWPEDPENPNEGVQFDAVVMNPPYSVKNWNKAGLKVSDPRFEIAGALPPDSKGDYAFLLHGLYHLGTNGTMAIVLPHGVLFRGASEGEIRKKLIDKNQIDTIIGLPNNLFTNTGIPVVVIVLKKNRSITEPILLIDASNNFIKVGKQNVLQEKDIAQIVDTYVSRKETEGFSHLATRDEIISNEYNMNIPRYVKALDSEIAHDVDAHLYGGIPLKNISELKVLNKLVPDVIEENLEHIRSGYVALKSSIDFISETILNHEKIQSISNELRIDIKEFTNRHWNVLKSIDENSDLSKVENDMLEDIKELLSKYEDINVYEGYQLVAEIWKQSLVNDTELIANTGFYEVGRSRVPNIVTKGTGKKKREEQDGWIGSIVPNELIAKELYSEKLDTIDSKRSRIQEIESELTELVEATKVEDSEENEILVDVLKRTKEDELGDSFEKKLVKSELKKANKNSKEYVLLKRLDSLYTTESRLTKEVKDDEIELKNVIQDRIEKLSNEEIDKIMFKKWFGEIGIQTENLIQVVIKKELETLKKLQQRYSSTLNELDEEIDGLFKEFNELSEGLVVI